MAVPVEHVWLFWDVDPRAIDLARDRRYVLGRVLERGRLTDVRWAVSQYGLDGVRAFFQAGAHPDLSRKTRSFWRAFFKVTGDEWPDASSFRIRRDFWDLHEILRSGTVTLESALSSYSRRYGVKESDLYHVIRSLTFFDDAEADALMPEGMSKESWEAIKAWFVEHAPKALATSLE